MIVYRCDRCKKDIDFENPFSKEVCLKLEAKPYSCYGFNITKHYLLCEKCRESFENFMDMDGLE